MNTSPAMLSDAGRRPPDFFLTCAGEMRGDLATPRACWSVGRVQQSNRDDWLLIDVDPPVIGQAFGFGRRDLTRLAVGVHVQGDTLFPIKTWPMQVYVCTWKQLDEDGASERRYDELMIIGWGELYRTMKGALDAFRYSDAGWDDAMRSH